MPQWKLTRDFIEQIIRGQADNIRPKDGSPDGYLVSCDALAVGIEANRIVIKALYEDVVLFELYSPPLGVGDTVTLNNFSFELPAFVTP